MPLAAKILDDPAYKTLTFSLQNEIWRNQNEIFWRFSEIQDRFGEIKVRFSEIIVDFFRFTCYNVNGKIA